MYRCKLARSHQTLLVIIDDLRLIGVPVSPPKTDPPLVVDADTVLTGSFSPKSLQSIAGWYAEIAETRRRVHDAELSEGNTLDILSQLPNRQPVE
jgi:hypothetical protein